MKQLEVKVSPGPVLSSLSPRRTKASSRGVTQISYPPHTKWQPAMGLEGLHRSLFICAAELKSGSSQIRKKEKFKSFGPSKQCSPMSLGQS